MESDDVGELNENKSPKTRKGKGQMSGLPGEEKRVDFQVTEGGIRATGCLALALERKMRDWFEVALGEESPNRILTEMEI